MSVTNNDAAALGTAIHKIAETATRHPYEDIDWNRSWAKRVRRACKRGRISPLEKKRMLDKLEFESLAASASDKAASRV